jgi:SNF2 family DNA or RNA helicase
LLQPTTKAIEKKPKKRVNYTEPSDSIDSEQESMGESSFEQEELLEGDYDNLQDSKIDRSTADGAVKKKHSAAWTATRGLQNKIMQLRKVCNHPYLFCYPTHPDDPTRPLVNNDVIRKSGKMRLLDQLLTELRHRKHKVLLFSQMSRMLDILGDYLELRGFSFSRIDGSVSQPERQAEIQRFNNDPKCGVFLLSTRAGGLGLNLVAADTVIFYDSDWVATTI